MTFGNDKTGNGIWKWHLEIVFGNDKTGNEKTGNDKARNGRLEMTKPEMVDWK